MKIKMIFFEHKNHVQRLEIHVKLFYIYLCQKLYIRILHIPPNLI